MQIAEETLERELPVTVNLIDSFVDLNARAFKLNLNNRQAVDQNRHIISILVGNIILMGRIHRDLMGHLIDVPVSVIREEIQINCLPVIKRQNVLITEQLRRLIHRMVVQMNQDTVPFCITERSRAFGFF